MKAWHLTITTVLLLGCSNQAAQTEPSGTPPNRGGPTYRPLRLLPKGAVFSADGKLLLTSYIVEDAPDRPYKAPSLVLWEVDSGKKLWDATDKENLEPLGFLANGKTALVRGYNHGYTSLQVWDMVKGKRVRILPPPPNEFINCVSLSHNGKFALAVVYPRGGSGPTRLDLWDVALQKPIRKFGESSYYTGVYRLLFSPDDRLAMSSIYASKKQPTSVILWDVSTGKMIQSFSMERYIGTLAGFFPDGRRAFCRRPGGARQKARLGIWEISTGRELYELKVPEGASDACAVDNEHLLFSGAEMLSYVDCTNGKTIWTQKVGSTGFYLSSIAVSGNGKLAFTGIGSSSYIAGVVRRAGYGGIKLVLWDMKKGEALRELSDPGWTK